MADLRTGSGGGHFGLCKTPILEYKFMLYNKFNLISYDRYIIFISIFVTIIECG